MMQHLSAGIAFAALAVSTSTGATAQIAGGGTSTPSQRFDRDRTTQSGFLGNPSDLRPDRDTPQSLNSYSQMLEAARCTAKIGRKPSVNALNQQPNTAAERTQIRLIDERIFSCRGTALSRIASLQRGSLAEAVYKTSPLEGADLAGLQPGSPRYNDFLRVQRTFNGEMEADDRPMTLATTCLVAQRPGLADGVLRTRHGSAEEVRAMDSLFASAPGCAGAARPQGISRSFLRAFLADSLQRFGVFVATEGKKAG